MIYKAQIIVDPLVEEAYREGMRELNEFWGINWVENTPDVYIVGSRSEIDQIKGRGTSDQLVGWSKNRNIFVLDYQKVETESSYKLSSDQYKALIKHELNHLFYSIVSGGASGPLWLREGLSIHLSGQTSLGQWSRPAELKGFIDSDSNIENKKYAYAEGGFVIEMLNHKLGKEKIIQLVKQLKTIKNLDEFKVLFLEVFGVALDYNTINGLYLQK